MAVLLYGGPRPEDRSKVSLIPRLRIRRIIGYAESGSAVHMRVPECEAAHIWKITRSVFHRRTGITRRSSWSVLHWLAAGSSLSAHVARESTMIKKLSLPRLCWLRGSFDVRQPRYDRHTGGIHHEPAGHGRRSRGFARSWFRKAPHAEPGFS